MELKNKFLINSLVGIIAGMIVGIVFWMINSETVQGSGFILHVIVSGIHGLIPCGAATVYEIESWGVTKSTIVHATVTLATILAIEIPMKWFSSPVEFAIALIIYVVIYTVIWLCIFLYWKNTVKEMNRLLEDYLRNKNIGGI